MTALKFNFFSNPKLYFGAGKLNLLPDLIKTYGKSVLLITGAVSFKKSRGWPGLLTAMEKNSVTIHTASVKTEPSPGIIDSIVDRYQHERIDVVAAIGGGSVLDAGKAVSAMMTKKESVFDYLEGVGGKSHDGKKIPFIALPTTSGTGSEATKNAVISRTGPHGFKKSLRHDNFIPEMVIIDPELTLDCPPDITAACGMDALTQLLESLVSVKASAMTDCLALSGLEISGDSLIKAAVADSNDIGSRARLSYAAYISGLTLANAGLGVVHGFASAIGGLFDIPHGVVCGTLLAETTEKNIDALIRHAPQSPALLKYARAGRLLGNPEAPGNPIENCRSLITLLKRWTNRLNMPRLGAYGVTIENIDQIVAGTGQKNNPVQHPHQVLARILTARI